VFTIGSECHLKPPCMFCVHPVRQMCLFSAERMFLTLENSFSNVYFCIKTFIHQEMVAELYYLFI